MIRSESRLIFRSVARTRNSRITVRVLPAISFDEANGSSLYELCTLDDVSYEHITAEVQRLDKLTAKHLTAVAKGFGVVPAMTKKVSLEAILEKDHAQKNSCAELVLK